MSDLLTHPLWQRSDLGKPLPDSPHAVSVSMPCWDHVVGYEEGDSAVMERLWCGYPRFVMHPYVRRLFAVCSDRFAGRGETAVAFPSWAVAERCAAFLRERGAFPTRLEDFGSHGIVAAVLPEAAYEEARHFWMHFGEVVSSRHALAAVEGTPPPEDSAAARESLRARLARLSGVPTRDVFLYPSGMAALSEALRVVRAEAPGAKTVQLGFPYVDVLKVQRATGPGAHIVNPPEDWDALAGLLRRETVAAVVCEFPGNPLLQSVDLPRLSALLRGHGVPLIMDDTAGTCVNTDLRPHADLVMTSLTKHFSGKGDVMAGALILNEASPFHAAHGARLRKHHEDLLYGDDAVALEANSRDFAERMRRINATAEALCERLAEHPAVARVYYPKFEHREHYARSMRPGGGYGGLFSLLLKDAPKHAVAFYDRLRVCKGPSLGNNFTMACPYTLLAHYGELDWAESLGVSRWLVRVSVGLEDQEDLWERFHEALQKNRD